MNKFFRFIFILFFGFQLQAQQKIEAFFDFNKSKINPKAKVKLDSLISNQANLQIIKIHGFSDKIDNNKYNDSLSLKRAKKVYEYFVANKINVVHDIEVKGFGENFKQSEFQNFNRKVVVYYTVIPVNILKVKKNSGGESSNFTETQEEEIAFNLIEAENNLVQKFNKAKVGDLITLENLNFQLNSEILVKESEPILLKLLQILENHPKLKIEIYGHICCNRNPNDVKLSYRRSKFIFDYLIQNGILTSRLGHRGFGSARPIYKIPEKSAVQEQANRRIEIEIMAN